ncbi:ABC transporter [Aeromicrobium phragmitis]|uniref:ABC transporter n=1 Tax=Aeromicrobium phragmitis TaxID=2478914 RepID=A0A3L8PK90_9ACTN|nr:GTPase [Aeromicrobium phragmitis]RLV55133.1 ABC transporter [Aeromicrobium phragmitis]
MTGPLDDRLAALEAAVAAAEGRLRDDQLDGARTALSRASVRLRKSAAHTIVALGGATGSGKSSLFNALSGIDLAGVGVKRPTTSWTLACTWGEDDASELLGWIGIPPRHQLTRQGPLDDADGTDSSLDGLVLLDMPDHDSVVEAHQLEVDRVVEFADLFVWVLDPQKYADAAIHERYLQPLSRHRETTIVVMNQIDRLATEADRVTALNDLRRILDREGLTGVPIIATSARSGRGLDDLRAEISRRTVAKDAAVTRLTAEVRTAAQELADVGGTSAPRGLQPEDRDRLVAALEAGTGSAQIAQSVEFATVSAGTAATDWPPFGLIARGRQRRADQELEATSDRTAVEHARAELAIREAAESAVEGTAPAWRASMLRAAGGSGAVANRVDAEVRALDLREQGTPVWWGLVGVLQWALFAAMLLGVGWLILAAVGVVSAGPSLLGLPAALWLAAVGGLGGIGLTWMSRALVRSAARRRAEYVVEQIRATVGRVVDDEILARIERELRAYETFRTRVRDAAA